MANKPLPVTVTFLDIPATLTLTSRIENKANKLLTFFVPIEYCKAILAIPQNRKHQGKLFSVNIEIGVPGKTLVINHKQDEDLYVALREAFSAARRQLKHHADILHGRIKRHQDLASRQREYLAST